VGLTAGPAIFQMGVPAHESFPAKLFSRMHTKAVRAEMSAPALYRYVTDEVGRGGEGCVDLDIRRQRRDEAAVVAGGGDDVHRAARLDAELLRQWRARVAGHAPDLKKGHPTVALVNGGGGGN